jgi:ABC-type Fe3+-hydroxamate transport system substrate-binding protein
MGDVQSYETPIMSMDEFEIGLLDKGAVHGVMLRSDENGYYNIGIQINDREVVKVASALEDDAMQKIQYWSEKVDDVRNQFKDRKPKLKPFDENN